MAATFMTGSSYTFIMTMFRHKFRGTLHTLSKARLVRIVCGWMFFRWCTTNSIWRRKPKAEITYIPNQMKAGNKFLSDGKYLILCLPRELDILPCHCWYISCNRRNMAAQTGSTYISGTSVNSVEIPTANLGFSTETSKKKVPRDDCDDDAQPEVAMWLPKPDFITLATL